MAVSLKSGDDGGRIDAMEARIKRLEDETSEIRSDLKSLLIGFAEMKGALKGLASAESVGDIKGTIGDLKGTIGDLKGTVGELKGRVALLTLANVSSAIGIATAVIVILNNWSVLKAWLVH